MPLRGDWQTLQFCCCAMHLLQEPSFVVVGHDPSSGEVHHYTYPGSKQSAFLPPAMSAPSDMAAQQTPASQPAACLPTSVQSAAVLGGGDSSGNLMPPDNLLPSSHHNVPDPRHQGVLIRIVYIVDA